MAHLAAWVTLLVLIRSACSQDISADEEVQARRVPRFGFGLFEPIRRSFCENYCTSADRTTYIVNLTCALKCPELYLPHETPTSSSTSTTTVSISTSNDPSSITTSSSSTTVTPSIAVTPSSSASTPSTSASTP